MNPFKWSRAQKAALFGSLVIGVMIVALAAGWNTVNSPTGAASPYVANTPAPATTTPVFTPPPTTPASPSPSISSGHTSFTTPTPSPSKTHTVAPPPPPPSSSPSSPCHLRWENGNPLPDPKCTPGRVLTTSVTDVCSPLWASDHREYFTKKEREAAFALYGIITTDPAGYGEYDHLIPLELGGGNSSFNLWPEKGSIPNAKDAVENKLHDAVCSGQVSLKAAQKDIATDWTTALQKLGVS